MRNASIISHSVICISCTWSVEVSSEDNDHICVTIVGLFCTFFVIFVLSTFKSFLKAHSVMLHVAVLTKIVACNFKLAFALALISLFCIKTFLSSMSNISKTTTLDVPSYHFIQDRGFSPINHNVVIRPKDYQCLPLVEKSH